MRLFIRYKTLDFFCREIFYNSLPLSAIKATVK
jgi:hypothetical protein